ncbi:hypothetical protein RSC2_01328 [Bacillus paralicheniformis]|nr:hypothetical protein RSC2_01328 [Bacillus paralicheniformis]
MKPLAFRMRPTKIEEVLGQDHLVGEGKIIHRMVQAKHLSSMILYGPRASAKRRSPRRLPAAQASLSES